MDDVNVVLAEVDINHARRQLRQQALYACCVWAGGWRVRIAVPAPSPRSWQPTAGLGGRTGTAARSRPVATLVRPARRSARP